ncbi:hypothetical protein, partial [Burkholderia gladioli]|uniref:hypothetical protein n=1 Tax=Burkholderia gladioli TaxID=28095 RepID=UPI0034DB79B1
LFRLRLGRFLVALVGLRAGRRARQRGLMTRMRRRGRCRWPRIGRRHLRRVRGEALRRVLSQAAPLSR